MSKIIDIYNPYDNQFATKYYVDTVAAALEQSGYTTCTVSSLKRQEGHDAIFVAYAYDAFRAHMHGYKKILLWIQGVTPEESYMRNHSKLRYWVLSMRERMGLAYANQILMVSAKMLEHYRQKYGMNLGNKTFLMPCFNTELNRDAFHYPEKYSRQVFVYTGSLAVWQCFEPTVQLFKKLEQQIPEARLDVYTSQKEEAEAILKQYGISNYSIDFVSPAELGERLKSVKFGFVIREDTEVNRVATPTKISTYTANGVIPIFSQCLDDFYRQTVGKHYFLSVGSDANNDDTLARITALSKEEIDINALEKEYTALFDGYYCYDMYVQKLCEFINL